MIWRVSAGEGYSSPVLWEHKLFLTRVSGERQREIVCFNARDGTETWAKAYGFEPHRQHRFNSFASSTPALDAERLFVLWTSGTDLVALALDHGGKELWRRLVGTYRAGHGSAALPILFEDLVIVPNDNEGDESFLTALDQKTGKTRWKLARQSASRRGAFSSPVVYRGEGRAPLVLFASTAHGLTAVDPKTGKLAWEVDLGLTQRCVASPCISGRRALVFAGSGGSGKESAIVEMPGADGDDAAIVHRPRRNLPYVPTALALGGRYYLVSDGGVASCVDPMTGEQAWRGRLDGTFFSSPVSNGKVIWVADREGRLHSLATGDEFRVLGSFDLGERIFATPAIAGDRLYVRTATELVCLGDGR